MESLIQFLIENDDAWWNSLSKEAQLMYTKVQVRHAAASDIYTPKEILNKMVKNSDISVREALAKNPNTPAEALVKLANDGDSDVRMQVAYNVNTPKEILLKLVQDKNNSVKIAAMNSLKEIHTEL